jgi:hypothetical protein
VVSSLPLGVRVRCKLIGIAVASWATLALGIQPKFSLTPPTVGQGQVALIQITPPPEKLTLKAGSQNIELWDCGRAEPIVFCGIVSVPLDTPVGDFAVTAQWGEQSKSLNLSVKKGHFQVNHLKVKPSITAPSEEEQAKIAQDKKDIEAAYSMPEAGALWEGIFDLPTTGGITSQFGNQRLYNGELKSTHFGVDLRADTTTPIYAANTGKVLLARLFFMAGNMVLLDHGHGIYSSYAHLSKIEVEPGQIAKKGQQIGIAGATGRVTGPHLHWSMRANGVPVDPHSLRRALNLAEKTKTPLTGIASSKRGRKKTSN